MESQSIPENTQPKKKNYIPFIIAGIVLLLCCCLIVAGVAIYSLRTGATGLSLPSYNGIADPELRTDTMNLLGQQEASTGCENITLSSGKVVNPPQADAGGVWTEMWTISACSESHLYAVTFSPDPAGGTNIHALRADQ